MSTFIRSIVCSPHPSFCSVQSHSILPERAQLKSIKLVVWNLIHLSFSTDGVVEASKYRYPAPLHLTATSESETDLRLVPKRIARLDTGITLVEGWDGEGEEGKGDGMGGSGKGGLGWVKGEKGGGMEGGDAIKRLRRVRTAESARTHPDCLRCYLERKGF